MDLHEPLKGLFGSSKIMYLDFSQIPADTPDSQNIQLYFQDCEARGLNPRLAENRQKFNNCVLQETGMRYLVSRYGEDRQAMLVGSQIAAEGRTLHMGIDIFSKDLETVYSPCDGEIVMTGNEPEDHGYGHFLIIKPDDIPEVYFFFGHLSKELPDLERVKAGQPIAKLGHYVDNENGGWSRHLHLQMITELPKKGTTPIGYSTKKDFQTNSKRFPNPMNYFPAWKII